MHSTMIVDRSAHPRWLSNTWLIGDRPGGHAVIIDTGGPMEPVLARIAQEQLTVTHVLCTHHHPDHVAHNADYRARFGCPIAGSPREPAWFPALDRELVDGDVIASGELRVRVLHLPGHTVGQLAFLVNDACVCTGDTLFRGSIGGTRNAGHGTFAELRSSILDILMRLPPGTRVLPGHQYETTIGAEWEANPFVRFWRGLDPAEDEPCSALGQPATLLKSARDYDGGTKHQVRWPDGTMDILPGSRVKRLPRGD